MLTAQELEKLKEDYFKKNAAFTKVIRQTTLENLKSIEHHKYLAGLRFQTLQSYELILEHMRT